MFAGLVILTAMSGYGMIRRPCWGIGFFLIVFSLLALVYAYILFGHSAEWFRSRDIKSKEWAAKHPRFIRIIAIIACGGVIWLLIELIC